MRENKLDHIITLVKGKVEEVSLPDGVEKVDIIISEWMGYCLLYESMLDTVIYARDKWLREDGLIFPDRASLFLVGIEDRQYKEEKIDCKWTDWPHLMVKFFEKEFALTLALSSSSFSGWGDVYGFNMNAIRRVAIREPLVDCVDKNQIVTSRGLLIELDLYKARVEDLAFTAPFQLKVQRDDYIQAFVAYFSVEFSKCHKRTGFNTSPECKYTHWKHTVFYMDKAITANQGTYVSGKFTVKPNSINKRDLDMEIEVEYHGPYDDVANTFTYKMR